MRVLRVNDWTGPPGGTEVYIASVSRALEARGHPQHVVSITNAPKVSEYRAASWEEVLPLRPMSPVRLMHDLGAHPRTLRRLEQVAEEFQPDLIHLHHFDSLFTPVARFLRSTGVPIVMTAHDAKLVCPIATLVLPDGKLCEGRILPRCQRTGCEVGLGLPYKLRQDQVFRRDVAPRVKVFIAPSRAAATIFERNELAPTRVLAPFIEVPDAVQKAPPPWSRGPPTVGFLGRLETYKGVETLLRAVAKAREKVPGLRVIVAGRGPQEAPLKSLAHQLRLDGVSEFPGWVDGERKEAFFARIQMLAVPSEGYENFGLIGLEALARGRPVLGSRLGGIPDWLEDGVNGLLLPPRDVQAWGEALVRTMEYPERLQAWGQAGLERYRSRFLPDVHLDGLLRIYQDVLKTSTAVAAS